MDKKKFGKKIRVTTYVAEATYDALRLFADSEDGERWEARVTRKALFEFLEKRGVDWKTGARRSGQSRFIVDRDDPSRDVVKPKRQKQGEVHD